MPIIERIRAHGGEVIRDGYRLRMRKGSLTPEAIAWVREHWREVCADVWPEFEEWEHDAAVREYVGGLSRDEAEAAAYRSVMGC
ncbi:MAG: hypothetical protein OEZ19_10210 [Paracoccaceae bacterium]|nr:hypothetical protein [Paracoccaceae bacterium]